MKDQDFLTNTEKTYVMDKELLIIPTVLEQSTPNILTVSESLLKKS